MSRSPAANGPVLRSALVALALVAGILAMHALGGGPHSVGAVGHGTPASNDRMGEGPVHELHTSGASAMGTAVLDGVANLTGGLSAQPDRAPVDPAAPMAMCLAMLLSAVVLIRRRQVQSLLPRHCADPARATVHRRGRQPGARPPDLLTELCVMRT